MEMPIPSDWDGEKTCRWSVCWPDSVEWFGILGGLLLLPTRGRFWDANTGSIIGVQSQFWPIYEKNFNLSEVIMSCDDSNIASALEAIADALASNSGGASATASANCGGGGGLVQNQSFSFSGSDVNVQSYITLPGGGQFPVMGTTPVPPLPSSGYPSGYSSQGDYDTDKCAKATKLANDWIASVRNFGATSWVGGVIGAVAIIACLVGAITVPPATIPLLLFALTANQLATALLIELANEMDGAKDEIICIFYEGETVDAIISLQADLLDGLIALIPGGGAAGEFLLQVALWLCNSDSLQFLFTAAAKGQYSTADCSGCGCEDFQITQDEAYDGTFEIIGNRLIMTTGPVKGHAPGCSYGWVVLNFSCVATVEFVSSSAIAPAGSCDPPNQGKYQLYNAGNPVFTGNDDPEVGQRFCVDFLAVQSDPGGGVTEFTFTEGCYS